MATLIKPDGSKSELKPKHDKFTLKEMQKAVGGYIEMLDLGNNELLIINEEGKLEGLPHNPVANRYVKERIELLPGDVIVGNALIVNEKELEE